MGIFAKVGRVAGHLVGPRHFVAPLNLPAIRRQHEDLQQAWHAVRHPVATEGDLVLRADRSIDFEATAARLRARAHLALDAGASPAAAAACRELATVTAEEMRLILRARLPATARNAWAYGAVSAASVLAWFVLAFLHPEQYTSAFYVSTWVVATACFAALCLRELWVNWAIRTGRLAPFSEFLRTTDTWMPSR